MAAAGFHQDGHSWSQSLRLKKQEPRSYLLHGRVLSYSKQLGRWQEWVHDRRCSSVQHLHIEKFHICNDGFIYPLTTLIFCIYIFVILHSLQLTLMSCQIDYAREKTVFSPSANKILNIWMVIGFLRQMKTEPGSRMTLSLVVSKTEFSQKMVAQLLLNHLKVNCRNVLVENSEFTEMLLQHQRYQRK